MYSGAWDKSMVEEILLKKKKYMVETRRDGIEQQARVAGVDEASDGGNPEQRIDD